MGLTYDPKPEFIEELIEKGSSQFLDAMSNLLAFAAGYEQREEKWVQRIY